MLQNFDHFCCISWEILEWKIFKILKMDQNWFYLIEQASDISKIIFSFIIYAYRLNKTIKTINKWTPQLSLFFDWPLIIWSKDSYRKVSLSLVYYLPDHKGSVKKKWELRCSFVNLLIVFAVLFKQHVWIMNESLIFSSMGQKVDSVRCQSYQYHFDTVGVSQIGYFWGELHDRSETKQESRR